MIIIKINRKINFKEDFLRKKFIYTLQTLISALIAWFSDKLGILFPLLLIFGGLMVADQISGMLASKKEALEYPDNPDYGWSSKKWRLGVFKKCGYILAVCSAMVVDFLIIKISEYIGVQVPASTLFGLLVIVWFILNEILSIIENAGRLGAAVPEFFQKILVVLKTKVEEKGEDGCL